MHGTIGQATLYAWQVAAGTGRGRQLRHAVPCIYFMNPMAYMGNNSLEYASTARADLYVDITDVIDKKGGSARLHLQPVLRWPLFTQAFRVR